jgi:hypothetical protein
VRLTSVFDIARTALPIDRERSRTRPGAGQLLQLATLARE